MFTETLVAVRRDGASGVGAHTVLIVTRKFLGLVYHRFEHYLGF